MHIPANVCSALPLRLTAICSLLALCAAASGGPFVNGDFETPSIVPTNSAVVNPGQTWLTGWTVGGPAGAITVFNGPNSGVSPYSGSQWLSMDQGTLYGATLTQTFTNTPGQTNVLSVAVTRDNESANNANLTVTVQASDGTVLA